MQNACLNWNDRWIVCICKQGVWGSAEVATHLLCPPSTGLAISVRDSKLPVRSHIGFILLGRTILGLINRLQTPNKNWNWRASKTNQICVYERITASGSNFSNILLAIGSRSKILLHLHIPDHAAWSGVRQDNYPPLPLRNHTLPFGSSIFASVPEF